MSTSTLSPHVMSPTFSRRLPPRPPLTNDELCKGDCELPKRVISFSGLDGSGKSHQIERLVAALGRADKSVVVVWMPFRIWPGSLLAWLPADLRSKLGPKRSRSASDDAGEASTRSSSVRPGRLVAKAVWTLTATVAAAS